MLVDMGSMPWHSTSLVNIIEAASQLRWVSTGGRMARRQLLGWEILLAVLNVAHAWPVMGVCVELVMAMALMTLTTSKGGQSLIVDHKKVL